MYKNYGVFPMYTMPPMEAMANNAMILRQRHLDTLRCSYPMARPYENGNVWDIPFQLTTGRPVTLRVFVHFTSCTFSVCVSNCTLFLLLLLACL